MQKSNTVAAGSFVDCGASQQLFYADWTHPIGHRFPNVTVYRAHLLARRSIACCVEDARPYHS